MCLSNVGDQQSPETFGQALNYSFDNAEFLKEKVRHKKHLLSAQKLRAMAGCPVALKALAAEGDVKKEIPLTEVPSATPADDWLALSTDVLRYFLAFANRSWEACGNSRAYQTIKKTTQPAHIVMFLSMTVLAALLFPSHKSNDSPHHAVTSLVYLCSLAGHFGSQFWMTFASGLSLYFNLPRHHFAEVQKVLFPLYFTINSAFSLITLGTFISLRQSDDRWAEEVNYQVICLALCFVVELLARLYLTPPLLQLITAKVEIEKTVEGVGLEVGRANLGPLMGCPHFRRIHKSFRRIHQAVAICNIATIGCSAFHLYYLAQKICM